MINHVEENDRLEKFIIEMLYLSKDCDDPRIREALRSAASILTILLNSFRAN